MSLHLLVTVPQWLAWAHRHCCPSSSPLLAPHYPHPASCRSHRCRLLGHRWDACHNTLCKGFLSDLSESGCLYGCSGVLEGALEEGLEQVRRRDDCKEYCRGLLEERDSISELKHVQPSLKTNAQWVGGCLDGCLAGYARKAAKHGARAVDGDSDGSGSAGGCAGVKNLAGDRSVLSCS